MTTPTNRRDFLRSGTVTGPQEPNSRRSFLGGAVATVAGGLVAGCASSQPAPGAAATAAGGTAGTMAAPGTQTTAQAQTAGGNPLGQAPVGGPGIETQSGQAIYRFPRDHAWHGGAFYQSNEYNEWHYITALGRD